MKALMMDFRFRMIAIIRVIKILLLWSNLPTRDFHRYIQQYIRIQSPLGKAKRAPKNQRLGILESLGPK